MDAKTDATAHSFHGRVEDDVLVRGHGRYIADAPLPNQAYAYFVRSPHAFARIVSIETSGAAGMPGVIAVLTAADMEASAIFRGIRRCRAAMAQSLSSPTGRRSPKTASCISAKPWPWSSPSAR